MNSGVALDTTVPFAERLVQRIRSEDESAYRIVEEFVELNSSEDIWLDFVEKSDATTASISVDDRRNLAKAISGFAHSDGGVLIWGITAKRTENNPEVPDLAIDCRPIHNVAAFYSNLNDIIPNATKPTVPGIQNLMVRRPDDSGYVITYVPRGNHPPYRAEWCNNRFYKRSVSSFYPLEPYDLRDLILRNGHPKLQLTHTLTQRSRTIGTSYLELEMKITNRGPLTVTDWKLVLEFSNAIAVHQPPIHADSQKNITAGGHEFKGSDTGVWRRVTIQTTQLPNRADCVIFPEDTVTILGRSSICSATAFFALSDDVHDQGGRPIYWRFFTNNTPSISGEALVY